MDKVVEFKEEADSQINTLTQYCFREEELEEEKKKFEPKRGERE